MCCAPPTYHRHIVGTRSHCIGIVLRELVEVFVAFLRVVARAVGEIGIAVAIPQQAADRASLHGKTRFGVVVHLEAQPPMRCIDWYGNSVPRHLTCRDGATVATVIGEVCHLGLTILAVALIADTGGFEGVAEITVIIDIFKRHPDVIGTGLQALIHPQNQLLANIAVVFEQAASPIILTRLGTALREGDF